MLWLVLAIGILVALFCLTIVYDWPSYLLAIIATIIFIGVGIITPLVFDLGYNERQLETTVELVSLGTDVTSEGYGNRRYVTVTGQKVYTYRYEVENTTELEGTMYKTDTVSGNVEEVESAECKVPMLYVYVEETKNAWWFSYKTSDRYTYVFYVPEGTIARDITLD